MVLKKVRDDFVAALWIAFLIYLVGTTYLMIDIQLRLGRIEHYLAHQLKEKCF